MFDDVKSASFPEAKRAEMTECFLEQPDTADFAIEDFRRWKRWDMTSRILKLLERESHQTKLIRKAVLRFALQSPNTAAIAFVAKMRKLDAIHVDETKELLDLETAVNPCSK